MDASTYLVMELGAGTGLNRRDSESSRASEPRTEEERTRPLAQKKQGFAESVVLSPDHSIEFRLDDETCAYRPLVFLLQAQNSSNSKHSAFAVLDSLAFSHERTACDGKTWSTDRTKGRATMRLLRQ